MEQFTTRLGNGNNHLLQNEKSPVFIQFLDCVFQVMTQFPEYFEFNEQLLLTIADHSTSCKFGTFLCDSEKQRLALKVREKTISLWSYVNSNTYKYTNHSCHLHSNAPTWAGSNSPSWASQDNLVLNEPPESALIIPKFELKDLTFWHRYFVEK